MPTNTLLVIVADRISDIITKGEYPNRYYNPGELFDDVHILMTNDDQPSPSLVQRTVGRAQLHLHNLSVPPVMHTLGRQPFLLRDWVEAGIDLARRISPALIRTYGNFYNGYLAAKIKKRLGIPLVVSLHINPDEDTRGRASLWSNWKDWLFYKHMLVFEKETLRTADWVLPVYEPIREYTQRRGAKNVQVCYNMLNIEHLHKKCSYDLHSPPRILSVGRQFQEKNPDNLIRAVAQLEVELTLVGDGPHHEHLRAVAEECGITDQVTFHRAIPNDSLCEMLPDYDVFAIHSEYWELSKSVLEPLLTGLPIVMNRRKGKPVPELQGDWVILVENTPEAYYVALRHLLTDHAARETLGRRAYVHAQKHYAPEKTEKVFVDLYRSLVPGL